jgi:DNA repair photolyase
MRGSLMDGKLPVLQPLRGRGAVRNPPNRFEPIAFEPDPETAGEDTPLRTRYYRDTTRVVIARNNSPDVGFDFSINPYRGCEHGCIYCYARPTHEYFGLSAGLDFETRIFVKEDAPELLRTELAATKWKPATIAMSGVTDPYQPIERKLELTRRCLQVLADFRNPVGIVTKNHLVARDVDLLAEMAGDNAARVMVSITTLDPELQRLMEPRTSSPTLRLAAVRKLADEGVPVGVMVAPVIPGLTDHEMPSILKAASEAGAGTAAFIPIRLPFAVAGLFEEWLTVHFPDRAAKVMGRIRGIRGGKQNDPRFGSRMRGEGQYADQLKALFDASCGRLGLNRERPKLSTAAWRGPLVADEKRSGGQLSLF